MKWIALGAALVIIYLVARGFVDSHCFFHHYYGSREYMVCK